MKNIFALIMMLVAVISASATEYTGNLSVTVAGETADQGKTTILVDEADGKYTLTLKNFTFVAGEDGIPVGNIVISDLEGTTTDGTTTFDAEATATVTDGDEGTVWYGPILFADGINVSLKATMTETSMTAEITMNVMDMSIIVNFEPDKNETSYTNKLSVTVAGETADQGEATILVSETDGKYTFTLKNFTFMAGDNSIPVGNIVISGLDGTVADGTTTFDASVTATVTDGDEGTVWYGPMLFSDGIDVTLKATMTEQELNAEITMNVAGQDIVVNFGSLVDQISTITSDKNHNAKMFDLSGRQIINPKNGDVYIKKLTNGAIKKFVQK